MTTIRLSTMSGEGTQQRVDWKTGALGGLVVGLAAPAAFFALRGKPVLGNWLALTVSAQAGALFGAGLGALYHRSRSPAYEGPSGATTFVAPDGKVAVAALRSQQRHLHWSHNSLQYEHSSYQTVRLEADGKLPAGATAPVVRPPKARGAGTPRGAMFRANGDMDLIAPGEPREHTIRLDRAGSFKGSGLANTQGRHSDIIQTETDASAVLPDGTMYVVRDRGGTQVIDPRNPSGQPYGRGREVLELRRYTPDGKLDRSFGKNGATEVLRYADDVGIDGVQLAATAGRGAVVTLTYDANEGVGKPPSRNDGRHVRVFGEDGSLQRRFDGDGDKQVGAGVRAAVQHDGKIVTYRGRNEGGGTIKRYAADGSLDRSFGKSGVIEVPGGPRESLSSVVPLRDNRLIAVSDLSGPPSGVTLRRLREDGSIDPRYGGNGTVRVVQ